MCEGCKWLIYGPIFAVEHREVASDQRVLNFLQEKSKVIILQLSYYLFMKPKPSNYHYIPLHQSAGMKTYMFVVTLKPDEDGWRAFHPNLEHLGVSTWGKTQEEALHNIQEVLEMIVEEFTEEGKEIPVTAGITITEGPAVIVVR